MSDSDSNITNIVNIVTTIVIISCLLCVIGLAYATIKRDGNGFVLMSISILVLFITCFIEIAITGRSELGEGILDIMS